MTVWKVPLKPKPLVLYTRIGARIYQLRTYYADADDGNGGWGLDISNVDGAPIVCGIPLVTGVDLLAQYSYLGIGVPLYVATDGDTYARPTFSDLGLTSNVFFDDSVAT